MLRLSPAQRGSEYMYQYSQLPKYRHTPVWHTPTHRSDIFFSWYVLRRRLKYLCYRRNDRYPGEFQGKGVEVVQKGK